MPKYDLIVIGAGSGGVRAARRAASLGKKVALFEKSKPGGTCVLKGCIPKKLMLYGSNLPNAIKLSKEYGWSVSSFQLNWLFQKERRQKELSRLSSIYDQLLQKSGVTLIQEEARFQSSNEVIAGGQVYQSDHIIIAVGGRPHLPSIQGIEYALTSDDIFELEQQPKSLIIVGAGYIALEFAGIFQSLGTNVSLVFRKDQVLRGFDQSVRSFFQEQSKLTGLTMIPNFQPSKIKLTNQQELCLFNDQGDTVQAEKILFATGRKPLVDSLDLQKAGIQMTDQKTIQVSSYFETTTKDVYAIGDCADTPFQLTPVALAEAELLISYLYKKQKKHVDYQLVPSAVFSYPNIATVGLTEEQAKKKGIHIQVFESKFRPLKLTINPVKTGENMYIKLIVDQKTDQVIGCHIVGEDCAEIIQGIAIAMQSKATKADFDQTIGLHPSSAEELCSMRTPRE